MSKRTAIIIMFFILGMVLIIHCLIFLEQIPYNKVWAGQLDSVEEMKVFEAFSILLNTFILIILSTKYRFLKQEEKNKVIDILIWSFSAFFMLNTIGNLFAQSAVELVLGGSLTLVSSILCFLIARNKTPSATH